MSHASRMAHLRFHYKLYLTKLNHTHLFSRNGERFFHIAFCIIITRGIRIGCGAAARFKNILISLAVHLPYGLLLLDNALVLDEYCLASVDAVCDFIVFCLTRKPIKYFYAEGFRTGIVNKCGRHTAVSDEPVA